MIRSMERQNYMNLETFRKNGLGMKTPVWFVQDGDTLFVRTIANAGKVKRVRNNQRVNIAPCKADGTLLGEWTPAIAREVKDAALAQEVDRLLDRKYGLMKKLFALMSTLQKKEYTVIEVKVE
jgi:PPOX class probable F420-dependent enzyme